MDTSKSSVTFKMENGELLPAKIHNFIKIKSDLTGFENLSGLILLQKITFNFRLLT